MLPAGDLWDAGAAAGPAAGFAGLLAAIVLIVNAQLAQSRDDVRRTHSRLLAPLGLVVLLIAAYQFILLSGEPTLRDVVSADPSAVERLMVELLRTPPLFTIAGSLLALGAVLSVLVIVVAVEETQRSKAPFTPAIFYVTLVAAMIFLLFGYDDARNSTPDAEGGQAWWILHILAIAVPFVTSVEGWRGRMSLDNMARINGQNTPEVRPTQMLAFVSGLVVFLVLPVLLYLLVSNGMGVTINCVTFGAALWFGCGAALAVNTLWTFDPAATE